MNQHPEDRKQDQTSDTADTSDNQSEQQPKPHMIDTRSQPLLSGNNSEPRPQLNSGGVYQYQNVQPENAFREEVWETPPPKNSFLQLFFSQGWKHGIFASDNQQAKKFVPLTQSVLASQILGVLVMIVLSSSANAYMVPAIATAAYSLVTINNSFDQQINELVGSYDSHGASLLLSVFLMMSITGNAALGFFPTLMMLLACLPFFFDGAMSVISAHSGRILQAVPDTETIVAQEESDGFQQATTQTASVENSTYQRASQQFMPQVWQDNPDLANRLTGDWKEDSLGVDPMRQVAGLAVILMTCGLSVFTDSTFGIVEYMVVARTVAGLSGYFGMDYSPISRFMRSNGVSGLMLLFNMFTLVIGLQPLSWSLMLLMMINLFDVHQGATVDMNPFREENQIRRTPNERFWLTSWRTNSFNEAQSGYTQTQIIFMGVQMMLACCAGAEGQIPFLLAATIFSSIASGMYSFVGNVPQVAALDGLQSNGSQVALTALSGINMLTNPQAGFLSMLMTTIMGLETYTSCTVWYAQNQNRLVGSVAQRTGLLQKGEDNDGFEQQ